MPKLGVMLVGWGGNNGSTVTAACIANRLGLRWRTKEGERKADYLGSITQASTMLLGTGPKGEIHVPFSSILPMVHPNDIVFDGKWPPFCCLEEERGGKQNTTREQVVQKWLNLQVLLL